MTSKDPVFTDAINDLAAAIAAKEAVKAPWKMATNGWVRGKCDDVVLCLC